MRSVGWRVMASAVACFGLSLAAGCDDDGGKTNDMAMNTTDMAVELDMSTPQPDMAVAKGTARLLLADVTGNIYAAAGGDNTPVAQGAHLLQTLISLPKLSLPGDYVEPSFSILPPHGCIADRYSFADIADAGIDPPQGDEDVGPLLITGYTPAVATNGVTTAPVPSSIVCGRGPAQAPYYGCVFKTTTDAGANPWDGTSTTSIFFPPVLPGAITNDPLADGTTGVTFAAAGGGDYAQPLNVNPTPVPAALKIVSIKKGGTDIGTTDLHSIGTLSATDELDITWSCDGSNTVGAGCPSPGSNGLDVVVLTIVTSGTTRSNFKRPGLENPNWGQIFCVDQTGKTATSPNGASRMVVPAGALAAFRGPSSAPNGSYQIALVRAQGTLGFSGGHNVFGAAGQGFFGLNNF